MVEFAKNTSSASSYIQPLSLCQYIEYGISFSTCKLKIDVSLRCVPSSLNWFISYILDHSESYTHC